MHHLLALLCVLFLLVGCGGDQPAGLPDIGDPPTPPVPEAERITVDHILIGVRNASFPKGKLNEDEAKQLAYEILVKLKDGADFETLKNEHSEDRSPGRPANGPYSLGNHGVRVAGPPTEYERQGMVPAFGDVGFTLPVGGFWIAPYHPKTSQFGFHIIKRVR